MMKTFGIAVFLTLATSAAWAQSVTDATYSLQTYGLEPNYRDQDGYGTCWTFGTMSSVESNLIKEGLLPQNTAGLSECDLAWHSGYGGGVDPLGGGGSYMLSSAYFARGDGPLLNSLAPYWSDPSGTGGSLLAGTDPYPNSTTPTLAPRAGRPAASYYVREIDWLHSAGDIKYALLNYGAVSTCWAVADLQGNWPPKSGGIVNSNSTYGSVHYQACAVDGGPDHGVAIVGWDNNVPAPSGTDGNGTHYAAADNGAWIIRNSWGTNTQHVAMSYDDYYSGNDPTAGAQNMGAVSFHSVVPNTFQNVALLPNSW